METGEVKTFKYSLRRLKVNGRWHNQMETAGAHHHKQYRPYMGSTDLIWVLFGF